MECYKDATSLPFGYLLIDCDPKTPRELKLRANIFPKDQAICYANI